VTAQAEMTSTYGHPRLNWPVMGRMNNIMASSYNISVK